MSTKKIIRRRKNKSRAAERALIERLVRADLTVTELAQEHGLSLEELAAWISSPVTTEVIQGLIRLSNLRTQMLLSQFRAQAAIQLMGIASAESETDITRKACVDLIKADVKVFEMKETGKASPPAPSEEAILKALEALGEEESHER